LIQTSRYLALAYPYHPVVYETEMVPVLSANTVTFLIAQEVNECDEVAGWTGDSEVLVSEEQVMNAEGLVLFVAPGLPLELPKNEDGDNSPSLEAEERGITAGEQLRAVSGKIKGLAYRYEKTGSSEIIAFVTGWTTNPSEPEYISNKDGQEKFTKKEIKGQTVVSINRSIGGIIENAYAANMFVGFYEYDWYISNKNLKRVKCPCNESVPDAKLAMKYSQEWYNTDKFCGLLSTLIPGTNGSKTLDNYKGTFVLKRQPL